MPLLLPVAATPTSQVAPHCHECLALRLNDLSERLGGRELRLLLGPEGKPRLPALSPEMLGLDAAGREALERAVVFLVPGSVWPGVAENGGAWTGPWARALQGLGVGRAVPLPYLRGPEWLAGFAPFQEPLFHRHEAALLALARAELARRPLPPGGRIFLVTHSYGGIPASGVAERLRGEGWPVQGMAILATHFKLTGHFVTRAPALPWVLVAENEPGYGVTVPKTRAGPPHGEPPGGTVVTTMLLPEATHMGLVLAPPVRLLVAICRAMAGASPSPPEDPGAGGAESPPPSNPGGSP